MCRQTKNKLLQVLKEQDRRPQSKSYMWLYRTGEQLGSPVVLYDYQTGRDHACPLAFLEGFKGFLQCDGHSAYKTLSSKRPEIELIGCMAHAPPKNSKKLWTSIPKKKGDNSQKISPPGSGV